MGKRFKLDELLVVGEGVKPASITFSSGTNLIIGSSDTGKSYIFQCIDYLLGAAQSPKDIPEARGYSLALLQLSDSNGNKHTISRALGGGNRAFYSKTNIREHGKNKIEIGTKNNTLSGKNISEILLTLIGANEVLIKTNAQNKTKLLSYRDISSLTIINEERIITETSPIYSSKDGYVNFTTEQSAFKYLLTGDLDNQLVQVEEPKIRETRIGGKLELLERLIHADNDSLEQLQKSLPAHSSTFIKSQIEELMQSIEESSNKIDTLTSDRSRIFTELSENKSKKLRNKELLERFILLRAHYYSDIHRLSFILDGEFIFSQLESKTCPLCGVLMTQEHLDCMSKELKDITAIKIEGEKIELKINDLSHTIETVEKEIIALDKKVNNCEIELATIEYTINNEFLPIRENLKEKLAILLGAQKTESEMELKKNNITTYHEEKSRLEEDLRNKPHVEQQNIKVGYSVLHSFCETIERILREWNYPNLTNVEFDGAHTIYDISISGRKRNSHGKGIRALTYSAFTLGLLDYCINNDTPHPGMVVLDSPLTTYHNNKDAAVVDPEEADMNMQNAFFKYLASIKEDRQIIVLDNKVPTPEIISQVNYISFTRSANNPRTGFFPVNENK